MLLARLKGWRRHVARLGAYYFIAVALITTYVAFVEGIHEAVILSILVFALPVSLVYLSMRGFDFLYQGFAKRRA